MTVRIRVVCSALCSRSCLGNAHANRASIQHELSRRLALEAAIVEELPQRTRDGFLNLCDRASRSFFAVTHSIRGEGPNPYRLYYVAPSTVEFFLTGEPFHPHYSYDECGRFDKYKPCTVSGDWDLEVTPVAETVIDRGLYQRFIEGRPWSDCVPHPNHWTATHPNVGKRYAQAALAPVEQFDRAASKRDVRVLVVHSE